MNLLSVSLLLFTVAWESQQKVPASAPPTRTFQIFLKGEAAGTEVVSESTDKDGNLVLRSEHEMLVSDGLEIKRVAFTTAAVLAKESLQPLHYRMQYTSGASHDSCEVKANGRQLTRILTRGSRTSETSTTITPGTVLLESNVYYLYEYLVRQYDAKKGGRQMFQAYLPPVGAEVPAALTRMQDSSLETPGGSVPVHNFRFEFVALANAVLSVDTAGRLVRFVNPTQEVEIRRKIDE